MAGPDLSGLRVLLLGSNERAALSVCRSLGRAGAVVEIAAFESLRQPAELSRYCKGRVYLGSPVTDPDGVRGRLAAHLDATPYDALFPITDAACELVYGAYQAFADHAAIIGPEPAAYFKAVDKAEAAHMAQEVGLEAPDSLLLRFGDDPAPAFARLNEGPVYVKPVQSCRLDGDILHTFDVKKCTRPAQLERKLAEDLPRGPVMVQRPVPGQGVGLNLLADRGRLIAVSMNRRLHEPPDGGGSSFRCNVPVPEAGMAVARDMAARLGWSGLMMIELKEDEAGRWTIMEMNCRPWGSIETALRAGVDFPALAVAAALGLDLNLPETPVTSDRPVRVRNLKNDLRWVIGQRSVGALLDWLGAVPRAALGREYLDIEQGDDLWPAFGQMNPVFARLAHKAGLAARMARARLTRRHRFRKLDPGAPLLFLCQGNINRSAVAEILFRAAGFTEVRSAGMLPLKGRAISPAAGRFVQDQGLDSSGHRSRPLHSHGAFLEAGAGIVVFDFRTLADLAMARPDLMPRAVLFDDLARTASGELRDPHGADEGAYRQCFDRIAAGLEDQTG